MEIFIFFHFPDFPGGFRSRRSIPRRAAASLHSAAARMLLCTQAAKTLHTICKKEKAFKRSF